MGRHPYRGCTSGVGFVALVLSTAIFVAEVAFALSPTVEDAVGPVGGKCWIFNHMNKSGGSTIKIMLMPWARQRGESVGLYDSQDWAVGMKQGAQTLLAQNDTITWGGYTEGLRPYGAQHCTWFTMFRHPISRLVSAYFYCQGRPHDQLCATQARGADTKDLLGFARHWGNYGLMQFVLAFVKPEDILPDEAAWAATPKKSVCLRHFGREHANRGCPGWYRLKLFVESRSVCPGQADTESECESTRPPLHQEWMHQFLQPVMDILDEKYAAVGLIEQWDASMQLFQSALELPGMDWVARSEKIGSANALTSGSGQTKKETLRKAWHDPKIRELLWLDILLYDHAVSVFNKQIEEHGLEVLQ